MRKYANPVFGCDQNCVDQCLDSSSLTFKGVPKCLDYCYCQGPIIDWNQGEYNYYSLMQYNNHNKKAWERVKHHVQAGFVNLGSACVT